MKTTDLAIVGAGAAGLMAAIAAGRACKVAGVAASITVLDGARTLGAKILVAGGGRCNVTHHAVDETAYAGSSRPAIRKVLGRFTVADTIDFFRELGVELKREETGKLFPTTDRARTVLDALLHAADAAGVRIINPSRVTGIDRADGMFVLRAGADDLAARRVVLATGGMSLPKTGSDGAGYQFARALGHSVTEHVFPALVPLQLPAAHPLTRLSGLASDVTVSVRSQAGDVHAAFTDALLCTHFGLSGPAVLDISRFWTDARRRDPGASLVINWLPSMTAPEVDGALQRLGNASIRRWLAARLPERLADTILEVAAVPGTTVGAALTRPQRMAIVREACEMIVPVTGDRGFAHAEVTAGGVPLSEVRLDTMESRLCPGLHLCGEILDVDGRIGGFNFQWAWASGHVAGTAAAELSRQAGEQWSR